LTFKVQAFTSRRSRKTLVRRQTQVKPLTDGDTICLIALISAVKPLENDKKSIALPSKVAS
jgi:preprotein translocase subunit YajC